MVDVFACFVFEFVVIFSLCSSLVDCVCGSIGDFLVASVGSSGFMFWCVFLCYGFGFCCLCLGELSQLSL